MDSILVKIEKVRSILKRDGLKYGLKNVGGKLWKLIKNIVRWPKGEIVFISNGVGDSAMYRTNYVAEELNMYGLRAEVLYRDDPFLLFKTKKFKVIILGKVSIDDKIKKLLKTARVLKQIIIYDTDDLVFDADIFKQTNAYKNFDEAQRRQYKDGIGLEILQSEQTKAITATTSFLASKLERFDKPVFVIKNKLSKQELKWAREARRIYLERARRNKNVRIGYFSGSISHNKDFATIVPALEIILTKYKNVKIYLVGYLDLNSKFYKKFQEQIIQLPFALRRKHYRNIAHVDINLAPLEMNDFCQAKSELKFFEAGIIGIPTVATRNQTFSEAINEEGECLRGDMNCFHPKRSGLLAGDTEEWVKKLELLVSDREMRIAIGERARQVVLKKYLTSSGDNYEYYKFLEEMLGEGKVNPKK